MRMKFLVSILSILAVGVMTASSAFAAENLYEAKGKVGKLGTTAPANFLAVNVGEPTLVAGTLTVKCRNSYVAGTVKENTGLAGNPKLSVQAVGFSECSGGTAGEVIVTTTTTTPWLLEWTAAENLKLTGVTALVSVPSVPLSCTVANTAGEFKLKWKNFVADSELEAAAQPLALTGTGCPATATESANYKFQVVSDKTNNMVLEP